MANVGRRIGCCLLLLLAVLAGAAERRVFAPLVANAAASRAALPQALAAGRCFAAELKYGETQTLVRGSSKDPLPAGRYRAHFPLALAPLGDVNISYVTLTLTAGEEKRTAGMLHFVRPDEFVDLTVDFTAPGGQDVPLAITWTITGEMAKMARAKALEAAAATMDPGDEKFDIDVKLGLVKEDAEGLVAIADLPKIPYRLAATGIHIEPLSPIIITQVTTDKVVYTPGETGTATVTLQNTLKTPVQAALRVALQPGLQDLRAVAAATLDLPAGGSATWTGPFDTKTLYWGADLTATARVGDGPETTASSSFGVAKNFWETALVAGMMFSADYKDPTAAERFMQRHRDNGFTALESGFWAPDEFGDFTPDPEIDIFFGGQGAYRGSVKGTKNVIAAGHKRGMACTVYANLWGGDGYDSYEMMRQHPDWFTGGGGAVTDWLENWDLMFRRKVPAIHVWPYTVINRENSLEALKVHARELVDSHRQIGWDGVRYDSYYSDAWVKMATDTVRKLVEAEVPYYRWGYNSLVPKDVEAGNLDVMCRGGQLVMEEGLRGAAKRPSSIAHYGKVLADYRDIVWSHDGHLAICYDKPMGVGYGGGKLDEIYLGASLLAVGAHPYYGVMENELGNFPRFALRYSEFLYKNTMRPLKAPEAAIALGPGGKFLHWQQLARTEHLGGDRHRVILHLLSAPAEDKTLSNLALKAPPPLRNYPVTVTLPAGATVQGAWALSPIPAPEHRALTPKTAGATVTLTVPEVRFWHVLVLDYTAKEGLR